MALLLLEVALLDASGPPIFQRIAQTALHLRELGFADAVIAARFGMSDKTVAKGIRKLRGLGNNGQTKEGHP